MEGVFDRFFVTQRQISHQANQKKNWSFDILTPDSPFYLIIPRDTKQLTKAADSVP